MKLGIDIGGTFIKYALIDNKFNIVEKWKIETKKFDKKDEFYDYICRNIRYLDKVECIGISAPGVIDEKSNVNSYAAKKLWTMKGTNVNVEMVKRTNKFVTTINDAKAAGLCELKIGCAKGSKSSAFIILGTGIGGCICNSKQVLIGKDGVAGEIHHMIFKDYRDNSIQRMGNLASITALIENYNKRALDENYVKYGKEVSELYLKGDKVAKEALNEFVDNICLQIMNISVIFNPEIIAIGGAISEEKWFIEVLSERFDKLCLEYFEEAIISTEIKACMYGNDANLLGAILYNKKEN